MNLSEVYTSIQGEGPRVGEPTIFVRFAGCNLRCPGWPCDTQHAIDPAKYRNEWKPLGPEQIFELIMAEHRRTGATNVSFTGGEPFLQNNNDLRALAKMCQPYNFTLEAWTNGTLEWPTWALYTFNFIMDWKLKGSGEQVDHVGIVATNGVRLRERDAVKFTVAEAADLEEAKTIWERFYKGMSSGPTIYVGAVYTKTDTADIAQWILDQKLPWKLNVQLHKYIWDPEARRT